MTDLPNIVLISVDSWRFDALGAAPDKHWLDRYGLSSRLHTPNLDRFVDESAYFSQAVVTAPHTTPSHASIFTGWNPPQHGVRSFLWERLPDEVETLAEMLGARGYRCIALREAEESGAPGLLQRAGLLRGFAVVHALQEVVSAARGACARRQPVLALLHLWDIHAPYLYSDTARRQGQLQPYWARAAELSERWKVEPAAPGHPSERAAVEFQRRVAQAIPDVQQRIHTLFSWYLDGVTWFDENRWPSVEATLREAGLWDGTLLFVFGDHGEGVYPEGEGMHVFDHGRSLLDDVLRVPLLVRGLPGSAGRRIDAQVSLVDLVPTVLEAVGLPSRPELPGRSLSEAAGPAARTADPGQNAGPPAESCAQANGGGAGEGPLHYAELCRGGPGFTRAHPSPQVLYQCCVRGRGHKVLGHCPPILMRRYRRWHDRLHVLSRALSEQVGRSPTKDTPADTGGDAAFRRWYWTDLRADPDEQRPQAWGGRLPDDVLALRAACESLVRLGIRGPYIDFEALEESAMLGRLAALGYVEP
jgi:arylsulfatase